MGCLSFKLGMPSQVI